MAAVIKDGVLAQAGSESTVYGLALRYEEDREQARNDVRWNRRAAILNIGRDLAGAATEYAQLAAGIFGRLGEQSARGAEGAIQWLGANSARQDTVYPQRPALRYPNYNNPVIKEVEVLTKQTPPPARIEAPPKILG
jgi:hypothetical protein